MGENDFDAILNLFDGRVSCVHWLYLGIEFLGLGPGSLDIARVVGIACRATNSPILMSSDSGMGRSTGKKTSCDSMKLTFANFSCFSRASLRDITQAG